MRKVQRALNTRQPMHLVIKCTRIIYGQRLLVEEILKTSARKFGVPVFDYAVASDHIHFVTKMPSREAYRKFIRAITGWLAMKFGAKLIKSVFTRIANWGFDYFNLLTYCRKNREEAFWQSQGKRFYYHRATPSWKSRANSCPGRGYTPT